MKITRQAFIALVIVNIFWGLTFPLINLALQYTDPYTFVALRCLLAAAVLLPFVVRDLRIAPRRLLWQGLILGVFNGLAYVAQTLGLKTIDPASSAFITGLNVILVPFLLPLFGLGKPRLFNIFCCLICLGGLYILTGAEFKQLNIGILWTLLCAVFFALFVVYLQKVTPTARHVTLLTFYQIAAAGLVAATFLLKEPAHITLNPTVIIAVVICGIFATALVLFLQTHYQRHLPTTEVALLYCLEPIFASIFSYFITGERFGINLIIGGAIILFSILLTEIEPQLRSKCFADGKCL